MEFIEQLRLLNVYKPDMAILDIGCDRGWLAHCLLRLNRTYDGVDIKNKLDIKSDKVRFFQESFESFIPDRKYDLIVARNVFFQAKGQIQQALRYMEYLKDGGVMCVSFLGKDDPWADKEFDGVEYYSVTEDEIVEFRKQINILWEDDTTKFAGTLLKGDIKDWHMYRFILKKK